VLAGYVGSSKVSPETQYGREIQVSSRAREEHDILNVEVLVAIDDTWLAGTTYIAPLVTITFQSTASFTSTSSFSQKHDRAYHEYFTSHNQYSKYAWYQ